MKVTMHFCKPGAQQGLPWSVHFNGKCFWVREIRCRVPMTSSWKPNKRDNPRAFFTANAQAVAIADGVAIIS